MTYMGAPYYPWWLANLAEDVTLEAPAVQGTLEGSEAVRKLVGTARELYENQEFSFVGDYGDNGYIEEYTCLLGGEPTKAVVTVHRNAAGQAAEITVNHRPRSSVLLFARLMGQRTVGTPYEKFYITDES